MPETMGSGLAVFDADGDGRLDLYFVQGAPLAGATSGAEPHEPNRLFLQQPDGTLRDATAESGLGDEGYGMGVTWGDVDADGDSDVYVSELRSRRPVRQSGRRSLRAGAEPAWALPSGARARASSTPTATATWTCTSWPTSTSASTTTSSAAIPRETGAPTAIRTSTTPPPTGSTATTAGGTSRT